MPRGRPRKFAPVEAAAIDNPTREATELDNERRSVSRGVPRERPDRTATIAEALSKAAEFVRGDLWIVGAAPLICHAWSEKARREMLGNQVRATRAGKEARQPMDEFRASLYEVRPGLYGFPVTAVKKAILSAAHKDKGIPRTEVADALWFRAKFIRQATALEGAICDVPLVRIWGSPPEVREDHVRLGVGMSKTASLAFRAQFTQWAMHLHFEMNRSVMSVAILSKLIEDGGRKSGLGDWRPEKNGLFGTFRLASKEEAQKWERFAAGRGAVPERIEDDFDEFELAEAA